MDNKAKFVQAIGEALRNYSRENVEKIYLADDETAIVVFTTGSELKVNVACSSPLATMFDIYKALV